MAKEKHNFFSKKDPISCCCILNCTQEALYKALPDARFPQTVQWMCLDHIKKHNATLNYFKDMGSEEIELEVRADGVWRRPTWPLNVHHHRFHFHFKGEDRVPDNIEEALRALSLKMPLTLEVLKKTYKQKVKEAHPDLNQGNKRGEEKMKQINLAYKILKDYLSR